MEIYTLDHLYDFLEKEHGYELVEITQKIIEEYVSRETRAMENVIDVLTDGLVNAEYIIKKYDEDSKQANKLSRDRLKKASSLVDMIYASVNPNYSVEVRL